MTEIEEKKTLEILNQVRTMLSKAFEDESNCTPKSFSNSIATDYPIKPIKNQGDFKFHGWCEIETQGGWVRKLNVEKAKKFFIRNLFVQLLSENGSILPREILLPTFLHELSHTGMAIQVVEFSRGGTKLARFLHKNQRTQSKLLNFENWTNGEPQ